MQIFAFGAWKTKGLFLDFSTGSQWSANKHSRSNKPQRFCQHRLMWNKWKCAMTDSIPCSHRRGAPGMNFCREGCWIGIVSWPGGSPGSHKNKYTSIKASVHYSICTWRCKSRDPERAWAVSSRHHQLHRKLVQKECSRFWGLVGKASWSPPDESGVCGVWIWSTAAALGYKRWYLGQPPSIWAVRSPELVLLFFLLLASLRF